MGAEPEQFGPAAQRLVERGFDVIDINFGCPVKKVLGRCRGGFHLSQPEVALEIVTRVRDAVPPHIPVTREDAPRHRRLGREPREVFRDLRRRLRARRRGDHRPRPHGDAAVRRPLALGVPARAEGSTPATRVVLGSGDLFDAQACLDMIRYTGVDGVTVARGAIGNPWIFAQARALAARRAAAGAADAPRAARRDRRALPPGRGDVRRRALRADDAQVRHQVLAAAPAAPRGARRLRDASTRPAPGATCSPSGTPSTPPACIPTIEEPNPLATAAPRCTSLRLANPPPREPDRRSRVLAFTTPPQTQLAESRSTQIDARASTAVPPVHTLRVLCASVVISAPEQPMTAAHDITDESWWSRPSGVREVLRIALPMVASTLSWTLMNFIDSAILFHYVSPAAMSAAFIGVDHLVRGAQPVLGHLFVRQHVRLAVLRRRPAREDRPRRVARRVARARCSRRSRSRRFRWRRCCSRRCTTPRRRGWNRSSFRSSAGARPACSRPRRSKRSSAAGRRTWVVMFVDAVAVLVNLVLACVLVLGLWAASSRGACRRRVGDGRRPVEPRRDVRRPHARGRQTGANSTRCTAPGSTCDLLRRLIRFGGPSGVQMMLDIGGFTVFVLLVGRVGDVRTRSHQPGLPRQPGGVHAGVGLRHGDRRCSSVSGWARIGPTSPAAPRARRSRSRSATWESSRCCSSPRRRCSCSASSIEELGAAAAESEAVRDLAVQLMRFVAAYNLFDATLIIFSSVLRGAGDTQVHHAAEHRVGRRADRAPRGWPSNALGVDIYGCWAIITVWIWLLAVDLLRALPAGQVAVDARHRPDAPRRRPRAGELRAGERSCAGRSRAASIDVIARLPQLLGHALPHAVADARRLRRSPAARPAASPTRTSARRQRRPPARQSLAPLAGRYSTRYRGQ